MICLGRPYYFKFFKVYLPQIWLGPFLNTLTHLLFSERIIEDERKILTFIYLRLVRDIPYKRWFQKNFCNIIFVKI